jgi:3-methyladenine DNA glycosylase AlkD
MHHAALIAQLGGALEAAASAPAALSLQRFFTEPVAALGLSNEQVRTTASKVVAQQPSLGAGDWLEIAGHFARSHAYHEHFILASSLAAIVARTVDDDLPFLALMQAWLEQDASNWAQCDDLCIKPLHVYLQGKPHRINEIFAWGASGGAWCRRASNVALVKLVGRSQHCDLAQVLANCERLLTDQDPYVQKGIGWMLKVAVQRAPKAVLPFLEQHVSVMERSTLRYAIEKLPQATRRSLMSATKNHRF